jgi:ankyrin repeat protein
VVKGYTALILACIRSKVSLLEIILKAGADVNAATNDVWTCVYLNAARAGYAVGIRLFLMWSRAIQR